jgi:hypothetical protein
MNGVVRVPRLALFVTAVVLSVLATVLVAQEWRADAAPGDSDSTFVPVTPCRLFDFRSGTDNVGAKSTPLGPGDSNRWTQLVWGSNGDCSVPTSAIGVSMNVTIANPTRQSNLRIFPADVPTPHASNLNWLAGQSPTPNKVDVKLSPDGKFKLFNFNGTVDVLADVVGYYTSTSLNEIDVRLKTLESAPPPLWAVVDNGPGLTCSLVRGRGAVSAEAFGASQCQVKFDRDVSSCVATPTPFSGLAEVLAQVYDDHANPVQEGLLKEEVLVVTFDPWIAAMAVRQDFYLTVSC